MNKVIMLHKLNISKKHSGTAKKRKKHKQTENSPEDNIMNTVIVSPVGQIFTSKCI